MIFTDMPPCWNGSKPGDGATAGQAIALSRIFYAALPAPARR